MNIMSEEVTENVIDLDKLDNVRPNGDGSYQAACPMCRHEGSDKSGNHLRVSPPKFNCAKYTRDKAHNAAILVLAGSRSDGVSLPATIIEPKPTMEEIHPDDILNRLVQDYTYWIDRGIPVEVMKQFEGGIALRGKMEYRYVFPMRDKNNRIHGFTGRSIKKNPVVRWKHIGKKENWIFDRYKTIEAVRATRVATLTEGIGCPLALRAVGIHGVLPIFGVVPSSRLLSLLVALNPDRIFVSLNNEPGNDKASLNGNEAAERTMGLLSNFFAPEKLIPRLPDEKDWLDCTLDQRYIFKKELYG